MGVRVKDAYDLEIEIVGQSFGLHEAAGLEGEYPTRRRLVLNGDEPIDLGFGPGGEKNTTGLKGIDPPCLGENLEPRLAVDCEHGWNAILLVMAIQMIATAKTARRDFDINETFEAGIALRGVEVKSLRESKVQLNDAYARFERNELWLVGLNIAKYTRASIQGSAEATRKRKLLLHRYELDRLSSKVNQDRLTLVPMALYFKDGRAKMEIGLGKGRKTVDKRQMIAKRDADREARRELAARNRR